jgi:hypothetical protein
LTIKARLFTFFAVLPWLAGPAGAQTTGEIYGKVTDASGAVVPGATVTVSSAVLIQPLSAVTSATGAYRFPSLPIGSYSVKFELAGFKTVVKEGVRVEIGLNAQVNASLPVSQMQEVVTVTGESPVIDLQSNARVNSFTQEALQSIPSGRDPWVILQQSAGIVLDRENIGGNQSGQQSGFTARGVSSTQHKWNLDGIDITDMSATGASPAYFDFDAFEEMRIQTGGADVTMQTPGVSINLVTKNASDRFKGSGRFLLTHDALQAKNISAELRQQGATSGNPIQNIKDYGAEMGGPIVRGKLWAWGSYGKQDIRIGVNNFFLRTPGCNAVKAAPLSFDIQEVWDCLSTDLTTLNNYNFKLTYQPSRNDQFAVLVNAAEKVRNARDASDLRPEETTFRQKAVTDDSLGSRWWKTGIPKTYKASWRHIFSDRFAMELQFAHVGNNFVLDFHEDALRDVQPTFEVTTGLWGRSFQASSFVRPTNLFDLSGTRASSGFLGGDHAVKFGVRYRQDRAISQNHRGGNVEARFRGGAPAEANMYRDSYTDYNLFDVSGYVQDTFTRGRVTVIAGLRIDRQWDRANPSQVPAHPFFGQATQTGTVFRHLPAIAFAGFDHGVKFNDVVPRLGLNWDVRGDGRSVLKLNYARYASQLGDGSLAGAYNPVAASFVRFPWTDLNGDRFVQAGEINISGTPLSFGGNYNPNDPTALVSSGSVDPNLKNEKTNEWIAAFDRQFGGSFAIGLAAIYRKYGDTRWDDRLNWSSANYAQRTFTPAATACPASQGAVCSTITYFEPTSRIPAPYLRTNQPGYSRDYKGLELTWRKRMSNRFTINGSFVVQDSVEQFEPGSFEDPTNVANRDGGEYAPQSGGSGIDNVFRSARWLGRVFGAYTLPWDVSLAASYEIREGYPSPREILTPVRANGGGQAVVYLARLGEDRLGSYNNLNLGVGKSVALGGGSRIKLMMDVFNAFNNDTVLSKRRRQNASNANRISALVAPRVLRFGARLDW